MNIAHVFENGERCSKKDNYRPISILPSVSENFEKIVHAKTRNKLEQAVTTGTSCNEIERAGTSLNRLERSGTRWS